VSEIIASRQMFIKDEERFAPMMITISRPEDAENGLFSCRVTFTSAPKYDANIKGADDINALECALSYIDSICANSQDPEFHWEETGARYRGRGYNMISEVN
jgi:hypothetical protein